MDEHDLIVKEIFAFYGRAMYLAQCLEKGIMNVLLINQFEKGITKTRYEELLQEKSGLTLGQLKREVENLGIFTEAELEEINMFHKQRDFLAHSYWWERTVEFYDPKLQPKLLKELDEFKVKFEELDIVITSKTSDFIIKSGINMDEIMSEMLNEGETVPFDKFIKLSKNESLINIFGYNETESSQIPIFELEDNTFWTVSDIGLSQYKLDVDEKKKFILEKINGIFPINQFNPRPKVIGPWNYELDLKKKGLKMKVPKADASSPMKWNIK
ncbi:hypothetical protein [Fulvivirga sp.]|uniref:hypothetical protein n=1 Tax=Fulvivirga sp. TaxID=1931237 RepID=UPI0032EC0289